MRTLIIGDITGYGEYLSCYLSRKRHTVILVDLFNEPQKSLNIKGKIIFKAQSPVHVQAMFDSFDYDSVIFIPSAPDFYCKDMVDMVPADKWLGDFIRILDKCVEKKIKKLVFCSSLYTSSADLSSKADGIPFIWDIKTAEDYCKRYEKVYGLNCLCLKLPEVVCIKGTGNFEKMIFNAVKTGLVVKYGKGSDYAEIISDMDVAQIIYRAMIMDITGIHEVSGHPMEQLQLQVIIGKLLNLNCQLVSAQLLGMPKSDRKFLDHDIKYQLLDDVDKTLNQIVVNAKAKKGDEVKKKQTKIFKNKFLPWIEIVLGGILVLFLTRTITESSPFFSANYMMIYVIIIAAMWGLKYGLISAVAAVALHYFNYSLLAGSTIGGIFNFQNNIGPVFIYGIAGALVGYGIDEIKRTLSRVLQDKEVLTDKLRFLSEHLRMTTAQNAELEHQVESYSDSFNNIYTVAKELDHIQPERVLISAIDVLEIALNTNSVSIYLLNKNNLGYARLMARSKGEINTGMASSLNMSLYPEIFSSLFTNEAYINKTMDKNYPAYAMYLYDGSMPIALIIIEQVEFKKYNPYYVNIFRVITGLIQTSLSHACRVFDPNNDSKYLLNSKILSTEALMEKYEAKKQLKIKKNIDFTSLVINNENLTISEASTLTRSFLRESDDIGLGNDGRYYILLSCTSEEDAQMVLGRFQSQEIDAMLVDMI